MVRVLIFEDNDQLRESLCSLVRANKEFGLAADYPNVNFVTKNVAEHTPDVVLMDIDMPGTNGIEAVRQLRAAGNTLPIIMLTVFDDNGNVLQAMKAGDGTTLSFGMQAGFINYKIDPSKLTLQDPTDPLFTPINQMKPNIGAGVMMKGDKFLVGISAPRLLNSSFDLGGQKINIYQQNFYFLGSYLFFLSERLVLKPAILLKAASASPLSTDLNVSLIIDRNYSAGLYTRNFNAYGIMAQVNFLEMYRLAYALEIPTNKSVGAQFVTNEVMLSIRTSIFTFHERSSSNF